MSTRIIPIEQIARTIRLDVDLARRYGVATGNLNKAVKRNKDRFPQDFMFRLTAAEAKRLIFQFGISNGRGGWRALPYVFTAQGVAMLSSVPRSECAVKVNIAIIEAIRQLMAPPDKTTPEIGFHVRETSPRYRTRKAR